MSATVVLHYWAWVREECIEIKADGCSKVTQAFKDSCLEHDLSYYYAKDPRDAYAWYLKSELDPWELAKPINRGEADALKAARLREHGLVGWAFSTWRWAGLRLGGWIAWRNHRRREAASR